MSRGARCEPSQLCLIACHTWDTLGAVAAGWNAALSRGGNDVLGVGPQPQIVGADLNDVADQLIARHKERANAAEKMNVVLAHGAWADGSSWARLFALRAPKASVAAPLPLTSLADDMAAVERTVERASGQVVLAGHAYAGGVIAATRNDRVKALVYVSALAPDEGETVADVFYRGSRIRWLQSWHRTHGLIYLPDDAFAAAFAPNASAEEQAVLSGVQRPISPACITKVGRPLWKDRPSWFLLAERTT